MNHRESRALLSVIGAMPIALSFIAGATKGLEILNVESQFRKEFARLDVVKVDWVGPTILTPTFAAHKPVSSHRLRPQFPPLHRVEEWVSRFAQLSSHIVIGHSRGAHRP